MCGRFSIAGFEGIEERFQLEIEFPDLKPNYNVAPSQDVPVILNKGSNQLALFKWGLIPYWAKDPSIGHKLINARAETVDEKPSFIGFYRHVTSTAEKCLFGSFTYYVNCDYLKSLHSGFPCFGKDFLESCCRNSSLRCIPNYIVNTLV